MTNTIFIGISLLLACTVAFAASPNNTPTIESSQASSIHDFKVKNIDGKKIKLSDYEGDVLLLVNVASQCGLTEPNYPRLEKLYKKYKDQGFRILAFPANNFGKQEPGSNASIKQFCKKKYHVTFDLFAKVSVKGDDQCDLYRYLTKHPNAKIAGDVPWNFQKYLVNREGEVIAKFDPRTLPDDPKLIDLLEKTLATPEVPNE